jgi:TonB family protein
LVFQSDADSILYASFVLSGSSSHTLGERPPLYRIDGREYTRLEEYKKWQEEYGWLNEIDNGAEAVPLRYSSDSHSVTWMLSRSAIREIKTGKSLELRYFLSGGGGFAETLFNLENSAEAIEKACPHPRFSKGMFRETSRVYGRDSQFLEYDTAPRVVTQRDPIYPEGARLVQGEGEVLVRVTISERGRVAGAKIEKSNGSPAFEKAALEAVHGWVFEPAKRDGKPIACQIVIPFRFHLRPRDR